MQEGINATQRTKEDTTWIAEGMQEGTLIWTTDGSYNRKRAADLLGVSWIIFWKQTGPNRIILGKVADRELLPSRNAWPVRPPSFGTRNHGILPGVRMDNHNIV